MVAALTLIGLLYVLVGCLLAFAMVTPYLFNPEKGPPLLAVLAMLFGWGLWLLWVWLFDGRRKPKES